MYRRGGVIVVDNIAIYTVFLAHVDTVSFDFCRAFLVGQLSGANIEKLLDDDGFYKKTHQHENMDMSLIKIPPAVTVFMLRVLLPLMFFIIRKTQFLFNPIKSQTRVFSRWRMVCLSRVRRPKWKRSNR